MLNSDNTHKQMIEGLISAMASPGGEQPELVETHISSVILAGEYAYKIKKPLDLGFLDFSTLERRKLFCNEEVRLNGRLAPEIYLSVVPITGTHGQPLLGGEGDAIEYAVKMRRFSDQGLLSRAPDRLDGALMTEIAGRLVAFHGEIEQAPSGETFGTPEAVLFPMIQNFDQLAGMIDDSALLARLDRLRRWTEVRFEVLHPLLDRRKRAGFIRECHGDLHLGNMTLEAGKLIIFDGIEFNPGLRWIDTMSELAFLLMDLDEKGRSDLAGLLLNTYVELGGDFEGLALVRFYQVYRAMVRTKVAAIRLGQQEEGGDGYDQTRDELLTYLALAESYTEPVRSALLITHGLSGSGKSTGCTRTPEWLPAIHVRSDVERKRLAGLTRDARTASGIGSGIYSQALTEQTYARLLTLAEKILAAGYTAVIDATFLRQVQRAPFLEKAAEFDVPFLVLDFDTPLPLMRERVERRERAGRDPSEAGVAVLEMQLGANEPFTEAEEGVVLGITPNRPLTAERLNQRLSG